MWTITFPSSCRQRTRPRFLREQRSERPWPRCRPQTWILGYMGWWGASTSALIIPPLPALVFLHLLYPVFPDFPPQVRYSILKDESGDSRLFSIDSRSGIIVTRASFDREQKSSYLVEVQSQDGSESARIGQQGQPNTGNCAATGFRSLRIGLKFVSPSSKVLNLHVVLN